MENIENGVLDTEPTVPNGTEPSVDYKALYEKLQKDNVNLDRYNKDLKQKYQAKLTDEEQHKQTLEEREAHYKQIERELSTTKTKAELLKTVADEAIVEKVATKFADGDNLGALRELNKYISAQKENLRKEIEQEYLMKNPTPPADQNTTKDYKYYLSSEKGMMELNQLQATNPQEYSRIINEMKK